MQPMVLGFISHTNSWHNKCNCTHPAHHDVPDHRLPQAAATVPVVALSVGLLLLLAVLLHGTQVHITPAQ
jgi:hypothetical protein